MDKMKRFAKGLDGFCTVCYRLGILAMGLALGIAAIAWLVVMSHPEMLDHFRMDLQFGGISFRLADSVMPGREYGFRMFLLATVLSVAQLPVFCMMCRSIRGILAPMKEGLPFDEKIEGHLRKLGWLIIAGGVISQVSGVVLRGNFLPGYDLGALFLSDKITHVTTGYSVDGTFLIYALVVFLLSYVFRYGAELQKLSDETL